MWSIGSQPTFRRYIPKDRPLHNHRCDNLKSYIIKLDWAVSRPIWTLLTIFFWWFARHWSPVAVITLNWYWRGSVWHQENWEAFVWFHVILERSVADITKFWYDMENACLPQNTPLPFSNDTRFERWNKFMIESPELAREEIQGPQYGEATFYPLLCKIALSET
jgi:hypothetical protein